MAHHKKKIWPEFYDRVYSGLKTAEVRDTFDWEVNVGDTITLEEWFPKAETYSGRAFTVAVTDIVRGGQFGLPENISVLSIKRLPLYDLEGLLSRVNEENKHGEVW